MPTRLQSLAVETTWAESERQVYDLVWQFQKKYNADFKTLLSEAALGYAVAYDSYDPDVGAFTTWVHRKVSGALLDYVRKEARRRKVENLGDMDEGVVQPDRKRFDLKRWMADLSSDAKKVVNLVFRPNMNVKLSMKQLGGESPVNFRMAVTEFLQDLGWDKLRIRQTFREIKESL